MTAWLVISAFCLLFALSYVSPRLAQRLFKAQPASEEITISVSFPHNLEPGTLIKVEDDILQVASVEGSRITLKKELVG